MPDVAIVLGSASDESVMRLAVPYLEYFGISYEFKISSAHRQPEETAAYAKSLAGRGVKIVIAGAGMAAHLPGVVASLTTLPVIGVPLSGSELSGVDALYAIVQMPAGVPVATVAIGNAGARNAAVLAAQILALGNAEINQKLLAFKTNNCKLPTVA